MPPSDSLPSSKPLVDNQPDESPAVGPRALAALHELAVAASGVLEPTALAKHAVDLACDLLGVDGAALYWWVSSTGLLHSLADNRGYQAGASRTLEPGKGVAGLAFQRQAPLIIDDYPNWEGAVPWALANGVRAAVGIPLLAGWVLLRRRSGKSPMTLPAAATVVITLLAWTIVRNLPGFPLIPTLLTH